MDNGFPCGGSVRVDVTVIDGPERTLVDPLSATSSITLGATDGSGHALFVLYNGNVNRYDWSGTRTILDAISIPPTQGATATDGLGRVLIGGGQMTNRVVNCYDLSGVRTTMPDLAVGRYRLAAATDGNGCVLFGGGSTNASAYVTTVDKFSLEGTRSSLTALSQARCSLAAAQIGSGKVLFAGGDISSGSVNPSAVVDCYDTSGTRTIISSLSVARMRMGAATDGNGNALFAGGHWYNWSPNGPVYETIVECYDPSGVRSILEPLGEGRHNLSGATDGLGRALFGGGQGRLGSVYFWSSMVDRYDLNKEHRVLEPLSVGRADLAAARNEDGAVLFAGGAGTDSSAVVDRYGVNKKVITIPAFNAYRFQEHDAEQPASPVVKVVLVNTPNHGYFKPVKGETTI